jgi:uncharacterized membrane protein YgcG
MWKTIVFRAFVLAFGLICIFSTAGIAQSPDQLLVVDDAQIFGNGISEVEAAANKLLSQGADIRVRTILNYGSAGNLDQYELQLEKQSPSWTGQDGDIKNNLIVFIISVQDRQAGLYYGSYWVDIIGDNWMRIQTDIVNPLFKKGDYTGGVINGLGEIQRIIAGKGQPQSVPQTVTSQSQSVPQPVTGQSQSASQAGSGQSNGWIIPVIIVVIIGLVVSLILFMNSRNNRAKRLAARQKAMLSKQAAASGINELIESIQLLEIKVNVMADKVTPDDAVPLRNGLEKVKGLLNLSSQTYSELSHSAGDPENPRLEVSQLAVIDGEYQKIVGNLRQAKESKQGVEEQISGIQQAIDIFPNRVSEVNSAIEYALKKQEEIKEIGFKTTYPDSLIAKGRNTLAQAQDMVSRKRLNEGMKSVDLAADQIKQAVQAAEELPREKQATETAIPALSSRIEQIKAAVGKGREVFERIEQVYAVSSWESIQGNGTEAENRINWTIEALDDAREAAGMEQQEWHKAMELIGKGNAWLNEAELLMKSISELEENLTAARRDSSNEIQAAQADVAKAWEYINLYDEDIRESLEDDLRAAEKKNELAKEELLQHKPDYLKVCKLAREANEAADKILIQARNEHEVAERLRAKAVSARRDASARVSIARTYIEVHHPAVGSEARNYLVKAVENLRQADTAVDTESQISLALNAESAADQAYSTAQRDVRSTTMNMPGPGIPPIRNTPIIIVPPMGGFGGSHPSWGTRRDSGSSSGNVIRHGGGGSTSWGSRGGSIGGGGASRGGGSTGW